MTTPSNHRIHSLNKKKGKLQNKSYSRQENKKILTLSKFFEERNHIMSAVTLKMNQNRRYLENPKILTD